MQYRTFGHTGTKVGEIGFGAWGIGGGWGRTDDAEALRSLEAALDAGVTFFDTAMGYGNGHSEELLAGALGARRDEVVIATKISPRNTKWPASDHDPADEVFPADWIVDCTEQSLRRLGTDRIDVQQLHCWSARWFNEGGWREAVTKLKEEGKVRHFGVSANDWDPYNTVSLAESGIVDSVQVIYNVFEQRPAEKLFPAALKHGVGIIVRVPFEEGLLTGKFAPGHVWDAGDWRKEWMTEERLVEARPRVAAVAEELDETYRDLPSLALKFILAHPAVSVVIPGMRTVAHVTANAAVSDLPALDESKLDRLRHQKWHHGWRYPWDRRGK